jgi:hypothetical protein
MTQVALQKPTELSASERQALDRYVTALQPWEVLDMTHTHEGYLVVVTKASAIEEEEIALSQRMAEIGTDILLDTGVYILLEQR